MIKKTITTLYGNLAPVHERYVHKAIFNKQDLEVKYKRIFLKHYGLSEYDTIMCWFCDNRIAVDIHHIESRSAAPSLRNEISNLIPLCREDHADYKIIFRQKDKLKEIVKRRMEDAKTS